MSYQPHSLVAFGGTLRTVAAGDEIWESTMRLYGGPFGTPSTSMDDAECEEYLGLIATPLATWFSAVNTSVATSTLLNYVKCNPIGADGKYAGTSAHTHVYSSPPAGNGSGVLPSFCSIVYSWRSSPGPSVGAATRGRMYLPNCAIPLSAGTASITSANQSTAATQAAALIALLTRTLGDGLLVTPAIMSKSGPAHQIRSVLVGNVIDLQRRRKNRVRETYVANVFVP